MQPGLALLSLGLVSATIGLSLSLAARGKARAIESWPTTPCQVLESYVKRTTGYATSEIQRRPNYYVPVVHYVYSVDGQELRGEGVRLGDFMFFKQMDAREVVDRYPPGATKIVHYNPANPEQAVLEGGTPPGRYGVLTIVGAAFILIGGFLTTFA